MENALEKLFGSPARVKILRLFLMNPDRFFTLKDISRSAKVNPTLARREISLLKDIHFISQRAEKIDKIIKLKNGKIKNKKKKIQGLKLNPLFPLLHPLKNIIIDAISLNKGKLVKLLNSVGKMKLIILAGVFLQSDDSKTDLLVVGDSIRRSALERILSKIESEIGKELTYAFFNTEEFLYRFGMSDHFIRDILDYPHEKIVNKLDI